jgi:hypothetical protein
MPFHPISKSYEQVINFFTQNQGVNKIICNF